MSFGFLPCEVIALSVTSPIVINMPTRELLDGETKNSFVYKNNVCKQISSLYSRSCPFKDHSIVLGG